MNNQPKSLFSFEKALNSAKCVSSYPAEWISKNLLYSKSGKRLPTLTEVIVLVIYERLKMCQWNRMKAAISLNVSIRTLRNWIFRMEKFGIEVPVNPRHSSKNEDHRSGVKLSRSKDSLHLGRKQSLH